MSAEVIEFKPGALGEGGKVPCDNVLSAALDKLDVVVVVGLDKDGELYVAGSDGSMMTVFLMERAKLLLVQNEVVR